MTNSKKKTSRKGTPSRRATPKTNEYYYLQGKKVNVQRREDLIAVKYRPRMPVENVKAFRTSRGVELKPSKEFEQMQHGDLRIYRMPSARSTEIESLTRDISSEPSVEKVGDVYVNEHDQPLVDTGEIVCKFNSNVTSDKIDAVKRDYGLETIQPLGFSENAFVLKVKPEVRGNTLEIANKLVEQGHAVYCYPNFVEYIGVRESTAVIEVRHGIHPSDPDFNQQWQLENSGQVVGGVTGTPGADVRATLAWQTTMGDPNFRLAVIDVGIDISHNDLNIPGKIVDPIDFMVSPPDNNPIGGSHGTEVSGMAVASSNNGCAGTGSAPNCKLIAVKASDVGPQILMALGFAYAADHGADVITCSLGPVGPWVLTDGLRDAIDYATTYGRNGRGCVYTQAVDNRTNPISIDEVSSYERSIAVSRTDNRDLYDGTATTLPSTPNQNMGPAMGPELDLCAPGKNVFTITNTTTTNLCTTRVVTGTSYATPLTAGVGLLILSVNPTLSWEEARQVLLDSADEIDAIQFPYTPAPVGRPPGNRNDRYGYGRVNAERAVQISQAGSRRDTYIRDVVGDTGTVPQPTWGFWDSPDIWVRNTDDNGTVHQNTIRNQDNFVYCRIWNRGTEPSLPIWIRFYLTTWAGTEFRYPFDFKPDTTTTYSGGTPGNLRPSAQFPAPATYLIGIQRIESIPSAGNTVSKIRWEQTLIPPATNWHPCLLVEISPHDGVTPTGEHVWENNNLGQKNITIIDAKRGQLVDFPFRFGHLKLKDPFIILDIHKDKVPRDFHAYLDVKDPKLLQDIVSAAGISFSVPGVSTVTPVSSIFPYSTPTRGHWFQWRIAFLEEAKMAISLAEMQEDRMDLVLTIPKGSSIGIGGGQMDSFSRERLKHMFVSEGEQGEESVLSSIKPPFSVIDLEGTKVLALDPELNVVKLKIPLVQSIWKESSFKVKISDNAVVGESYFFDLAETNSHGQLVGGVRLQLNVVA